MGIVQKELSIALPTMMGDQASELFLCAPGSASLQVPRAVCVPSCHHCHPAVQVPLSSWREEASVSGSVNAGSRGACTRKDQSGRSQNWLLLFLVKGRGFPLVKTEMNQLEISPSPRDRASECLRLTLGNKTPFVI